MAIGVEYQGQVGDFIKFVRPNEQPRFRAETGIPSDSVPELARQMGGKITQHPNVVGFVVPTKGYAEIVLRDDRWPPAPSSRLARNFFLLQSDESYCVHNEPDRQLPTLPFYLGGIPQRESSRISKRIHLVGQGRNPCMELSNASPLAMLLYGRAREGTSPLLLTVKIDHDGMAVAEDEFLQEVDKLVRSLIYELDIRNGRVLSVSSRAARQSRIPVRSRSVIRNVRYPEIEIQYEIADLFNFASQASDNLPLAFLSYYQTLEYFLPMTVRQNALGRVRRELRDPAFDRNSDNSLLRVLSVAERSMRLPESDQLRILVREYVRSDRLEEFFKAEWGNHFTRRGPIQTVESINTANSSKSLGDQVADRIYQIRNRIVHAKDDPRYEEARVLLPRSREAETLGPDIELVRFLASEAVLAAS